MKEILKILPATTLILVYFFLCGGLYLIGFWSTFEIDITNFVSLTDIPKSFVLPLAVGSSLTILNVFLLAIITSGHKESVDANKVEERPKSLKRFIFSRLISLDFVILLASASAFWFISANKLVFRYWIFFGMLMASLLMLKFDRIRSIRKLLPYYNLRLILAHTLILIPIACFGFGKGFSLRIFHNESIHIYQSIRPKNETGELSRLKLLGFLGDKLILSTTDNKKIVFINMSSKNEFVLTKENARRFNE